LNVRIKIALFFHDLDAKLPGNSLVLITNQFLQVIAIFKKEEAHLILHSFCWELKKRKPKEGEIIFILLS